MMRKFKAKNSFDLVGGGAEQRRIDEMGIELQLEHWAEMEIRKMRLVIIKLHLESDAWMTSSCASGAGLAPKRPSSFIHDSDMNNDMLKLLI